MAWVSIITPDARGSENGLVLRDEEYDAAARITLERDTHVAPFAITCGVYGWMMHTRFFALEAEAIAAYAAMKADLTAICAGLPLEGDADQADMTSASMEAMGAFVEKYP